MSTSYICSDGVPSPLGASKKGHTTNFALFSEHASGVTISLFHEYENAAFTEIPLDPEKNKTNNIWHIAIKNLPEKTTYAYRVDGETLPQQGLFFNSENYLLDPYAKGVTSSHTWVKERSNMLSYHPLGKIIDPHHFDWHGIKSPHIPYHELIIYEAHVRGFTIDPSSHVAHPGTFLGLIEKIPHLKELGINAIELLPIFEFDEGENKLDNPTTGKRLHNFWGYSTVNFFTPMNRFATSDAWDSSIVDCKMMIQKMHENGIEVFLDVVYNHTAECGTIGPTFSFKGIDNAIYYLMDKEGEYHNFSGTGNTLNCNHPVVRKMIIDSLCYWVKEFHIDGFRFDLASILTRDVDGEPMDAPPLITDILSHASLKKVKLIAEAWDATGLYQVGKFPGEGKWGEWNGKYRDITRRFIKGTDGHAGSFATALCGSEDLYGSDRAPYHSVNFITAHDGYSLHDLVSYQNKHNEANGENNSDGANDNESWNCGVEGPTDDTEILLLRKRQMKNFLVTLFVSAGTPMLLMGDEYGHTRKGNNNPYCQDNELNWFLWDELKKNKKLFSFCKDLIAFRKKNSRLFCRKKFLTDKEISWHGASPLKPDWQASSRFVAFTLHDKKGHSIFVAFNANYMPAHVELPEPDKGKKWYSIVNTSHEEQGNFVLKSALKTHITMKPYSSLVLQCH